MCVCMYVSGRGLIHIFPAAYLYYVFPTALKCQRCVNKTLHYRIGNIADHIGAAAGLGPGQQSRHYSERDRPPHPKWSPMTSQCHSCSASTHLPIKGLHHPSTVPKAHSPAPLERVEAPMAQGKENSFRKKTDR